MFLQNRTITLVILISAAGVGWPSGSDAQVDTLRQHDLRSQGLSADSGLFFQPPPHDGPVRIASLTSPIKGESVAREYEYVPGEYLSQSPTADGPCDGWGLQILPSGLIYSSYLAGPKEARFGSQVVNSRDDSTLWEATVGARVGLLRYGSFGSFFPEGFQIDAEGSAQTRLDIPEEVDLRSTDFRAGIVATWGDRQCQTKFGYYHISSHLGDEFLLKNPSPPLVRIPYRRDALILGRSWYWNDNLRTYAEVGWAFVREVTDPFELQFGVEWSPVGPTGICGAPFFAIDVHLREEVEYGGSLTVQTGWAWRGYDNAHLLRIGLHFQEGKSTQYSFFNEHEQLIGFGVWYSF